MDGSSSCTQVPGSQVNAERTCRRTSQVRANSTHRMAGFGQPLAVISSISSKLTLASRRALGTTRGSALNTPRDVGVELARVRLEGVGQGHRRGVRAASAEEGDVVGCRPTRPGRRPPPGCGPRPSAARSRSGRSSRILALVWVPSVMNPAWLPVKLSAGTPMSWRAMHTRAVALRSPAVINMSISRPGADLRHLDRPAGSVRRSPCPWRSRRARRRRPADACGRRGRLPRGSALDRPPRCRRTSGRRGPPGHATAAPLCPCNGFERDCRRSERRD